MMASLDMRVQLLASCSSSSALKLGGRFDLLGVGTIAGGVCKEIRLFMCAMGEILRSSKMSDGKSVCSVKVWDGWWGGGDDSA
jgi:hypothetical protein